VGSVKFHRVLGAATLTQDLPEGVVMKTVRIAITLICTITLLSACYVVPVRGPDGNLIYQPYVLPPVGSTPAGPSPSMAVPQVLHAKLYPANDLATQTGVVVGTVTNMMTGKGQFQVNYMGEVLNGEATRVSNDERRGVASAFSQKGSFMSCEYQMSTPLQGAGTCVFSNGAKYQLHVGGN
jgi:hypothetical protein